jgi:hypothetical protein
MASELEKDDPSLIEYYRRVNSDLRCSNLAILIHVRSPWARQAAMSAIDAELQEVREVLEGLRFKDGCWSRDCIHALGHHRPVCERARALLSKLEVKP